MILEGEDKMEKVTFCDLIYPTMICAGPIIESQTVIETEQYMIPYEDILVNLKDQENKHLEKKDNK